ncbi:26S proteasome non-ATPase regulatory subunit 6-like isoform X2 [Schistocerca cancellata]|uniref:26S proteasome non-ATPase regulatory subunit 6-like isoform X2 n=1 Tax=Schistocerca cancellata TaxID=274614 RepID=UPI002118C35D|nr:26S proteasome non-ATPase regulatory subunit 6-like isoform X2 [Schistocerca cancellata]
MFLNAKVIQRLLLLGESECLLKQVDNVKSFAIVYVNLWASIICVNLCARLTAEMLRALFINIVYDAVVRCFLKDEAVKNFQITYDKTVSLGQRLEIVFYLIRIGFFYWDHDLITRNIDKAESLIEEGDSWEHRNRMKVYKGIYSMMKRDFKSAANSFLDSSLTFTCYELMDYHEFIRYIVLMGVISVPRNELKEKIIKNSEVLEVLHNDRFMKDYVMSLYDCHYAEFFKNLAQVEDFLKHDYYLSPHYRHYIREMRLRAYTQILQCYQSLTLDFMADTFGVTAEFIDKELSRFISDRRVDGKIDKVSNIVVTDHPDAKNWQYQEIIRQGDTLLNRVQKLSRVINI